MIFKNPRVRTRFQSASARLGDQIADAQSRLKANVGNEARADGAEMLRAGQIPTEKRMFAYPHELSGGMCRA